MNINVDEHIRRYYPQVSDVVRYSWTCSDGLLHLHRYRWTAWLCGRVQYYLGYIP